MVIVIEGRYRPPRSVADSLQIPRKKLSNPYARNKQLPSHKSPPQASRIFNTTQKPTTQKNKKHQTQTQQHRRVSSPPPTKKKEAAEQLTNENFPSGMPKWPKARLRLR